MKHFLLTNWYKLITASAMLIFACAFFIYAVKNNSAVAGPNKPESIEQADHTPAELWFVANDSGIYAVSWNTTYRRYLCNRIFTASGTYIRPTP
jgi:hypothetical protein